MTEKFQLFIDDAMQDPDIRCHFFTNTVVQKKKHGCMGSSDLLVLFMKFAQVTRHPGDHCIMHIKGIN